MPDIIERSMVDLALDNMSTGTIEAIKALRSNINESWRQLTEARKTAVKTRNDAIDVQENNRKRRRNAAISQYKGAQGKPNPPSYESHQQELNAIDDQVDAEIQHARDICRAAGQSAENTFRTQSKEHIATFRKIVNEVLDNLEAAHP